MNQSVVIYGNEFAGQIKNGLVPQFFKYRFLVEGDSWMDRSAMFHTSLLQKLAPEMEAAEQPSLFINIAMFGDTMRRMGQGNNIDFFQWINTRFNGWKFDAVLLSAGGNDFIDAALDPDAGQGILVDVASAGIPTSGAACLNTDAVAKLSTQWLEPSFAGLYNIIQTSHLKDVPIFLNSYDTPTARHAPAFSGGKAWLWEAYKKNHIPDFLWPELTDAIFKAVVHQVNQWAINRNNVHVVPTTGTLVPAHPDATGSSGDWLNEIHPNAQGWNKLAKVWCGSVLQLFN
jgi:hypothetical protein